MSYHPRNPKCPACGAKARIAHGCTKVYVQCPRGCYATHNYYEEDEAWRGWDNLVDAITHKGDVEQFPATLRPQGPGTTS